MSVRRAILGDTVRILAVAEAARAKSRYADVGGIDRDYARKFFHKAIHNNGRTNDGGTLFLVCERDGVVEGYFLGGLDRIYQIGEKLVAVDVHIYTTPKADPRDANIMIEQYIAWAEGCEDVLEIVLSKSDLMGQENDIYGALLERKGFVQCGTSYRRPCAVAAANGAGTGKPVSREDASCLQ